MKQYSSCAPANDFRKMSSYRECLCAILKLLADFGKEVGFTAVPKTFVFF